MDFYEAFWLDVVLVVMLEVTMLISGQFSFRYLHTVPLLSPVMSAISICFSPWLA